MLKDGLLFDRKFITVGYDFYSLHMTWDKKRANNCKWWWIKYFRIRLNYKNKSYERETDLKNEDTKNSIIFNNIIFIIILY